MTRGSGSKHTHSGQNPTSMRSWRRGFIFKNERDRAEGLCGGLSVLSGRSDKEIKGACEAYRQSMENLKSYMQRQWSLVGGMAGTFREME